MTHQEFLRVQAQTSQASGQCALPLVWVTGHVTPHHNLCQKKKKILPYQATQVSLTLGGLTLEGQLRQAGSRDAPGPWGHCKAGLDVADAIR